MAIPRTIPKLNRPAYWVWVVPAADQDTTDLDAHQPELVVINAGDQLRAELEAKRHSIGSGKDNPMHLTTLWLWAAMVRTGAYAENYPRFKADLIAWDAPKDDDAEDATDAEGTPAGDVIPTGASTS